MYLPHPHRHATHKMNRWKDIFSRDPTLQITPQDKPQNKCNGLPFSWKHTFPKTLRCDAKEWYGFCQQIAGNFQSWNVDIGHWPSQISWRSSKFAPNCRADFLQTIEIYKSIFFSEKIIFAHVVFLTFGANSVDFRKFFLEFNILINLEFNIFCAELRSTLQVRTCLPRKRAIAESDSKTCFRHIKMAGRK